MLLGVGLALKEKIAIAIVAKDILPGADATILLVASSKRLKVIQPGCKPLTDTFEQLEYWLIDGPFTIAGLLSVPASISLGLTDSVYLDIEYHHLMDPQTGGGCFIILLHLLLSIPTKPKGYLNQTFIYLLTSKIFKDFSNQSALRSINH